MKAFLYLNLVAGKEAPYQQPILSAIKKELPAVTVLDVDSESDKLTLQMATRLLHEAEQAVICIKAEEEQTGFRSIMPILEQLLIPHPNRLLLLTGRPGRLLRMLQARPQVYFKYLQTETEVVEATKVYFGFK